MTIRPNQSARTFARNAAFALVAGATALGGIAAPALAQRDPAYASARASGRSPWSMVIACREMSKSRQQPCRRCSSAMESPPPETATPKVSGESGRMLSATCCARGRVIASGAAERLPLRGGIGNCGAGREAHGDL